MNGDREPVEGRVRRGPMRFAGVVALLLLAALPFVFGLLSGDGAPGEGERSKEPAAAPPSPTPASTEPGSSLHGRLVYTTLESPGRQRLAVLDLVTGNVARGPAVPTAEELHAAGARGEAVLLIADDGGDRGAAYLVTDVSPRVEPHEIATGEVLSPSSDGAKLLIGHTRPTGGPGECESHAYTLRRYDLVSGRERLLSDGRVACGDLVSATLDRGRLVASFVRDGRSEIRLLQQDETRVLFRGLSLVAAAATGAFLLSDPPGGELLVWPGSGAPRPVVTGSRLFAAHVLAWSGDGRDLLVAGALGDETGTWLVDTAGGTATPFPPAGYPLMRRITGATFADDGTLFASAPGRILASTGSALFPISLPPGAPYPAGPMAWLA